MTLSSPSLSSCRNLTPIPIGFLVETFTTSTAELNRRVPVPKLNILIKTLRRGNKNAKETMVISIILFLVHTSQRLH